MENFPNGTVRIDFRDGNEWTFRYVSPGQPMYSMCLFTGSAFWTGTEWKPINQNKEPTNAKRT